MNNNQRMPGIDRFAIILFVSSFFQLCILIGYERYKYMFQYLPENIILIRYIGSIFLRVLTVISALGIIYYKNVFRRILICVCIFHIVMVYWVHPYAAFVNFDRYYNISPERFNSWIAQVMGFVV